MRRPLVPLGAIIFYAVSYPIGAIAASIVSPFLLITLRFTVTAGALWLWLLLQHIREPQRAEPLVPRGRQLWWSVAAGALVQGMQFLAAYWAMAHGVGAGVCALVIAMNPVATALLNRSLHGVRENRWGYLALTSGTIGVVVACLPKLVSDPGLGPAVVATLIALIGLSGGSFLQGRQLTGVTPVAFTAIGVTASIPVAAILSTTTKNHVTDMVEAAVVLGVLVITSTLGTVLYAACVRRSGARQASILFAMIPAVAALASWGIQGVGIGVSTLVGLAFGSLACIAQVRSARPTSTASPAHITPHDHGNRGRTEVAE
nr:DMT family transporter [Microbacterium bovistercoris]